MSAVKDVNEDRRRALVDLIRRQDFDATVGKSWTVDEFIDAVFQIFATEVQDTRPRSYVIPCPSCRHHHPVATFCGVILDDGAAREKPTLCECRA